MMVHEIEAKIYVAVLRSLLLLVYGIAPPDSICRLLSVLVVLCNASPSYSRWWAGINGSLWFSGGAGTGT